MNQLLANPLFLGVIALLPALVLCIFIYKKDRAEKEPAWLLAVLMLAGVGIIPFVLIVGSILGPIFLNLFAPFGTVDAEGVLTLPMIPHVLYYIVHAFIEVALVEEGFKWLALLLITKNNKHFNSLFDGIIYAVFVSLGFAAFENVMYVMQYGWVNAVVRAVTSVPGHTFFAIFMGFYYSWWMVHKRADAYETSYQIRNRNGKPDVFKPGKFLALSLIVPTLAHGFYDFCCMVGLSWASILFIAFVIFMYIFCFRQVFRMSKQDTNLNALAVNTFRRMYPDAVIEEMDGGESGMTAPSVPGYTPAPAANQTPVGAKLYTFSNGDKFVGLMVDGKMTGQGTYFFAAGGKYQGNFENGTFQGQGVFEDANGGRYVGFWQGGHRHGSGTYYWPNGQKATGLWQNGALVQRY